MSKVICAALALSLCCAAPAFAQDAKSVIGKAQAAIGNPASLKIEGAGMNAFFGQALTAGKEWPRRDLESFKLDINYDQTSSSHCSVVRW